LARLGIRSKDVGIAEQLKVRKGRSDSIKQFSLQPPTDIFSIIKKVCMEVVY